MVRRSPLENSQAPDDEELIRGIREGSLESLEALYDRYHRQAFGLALRMTSSRETAEEVLQDAFMSVWRRARTFSPGSGAVRPWLFSIVHHRAVDCLRSSKGKTNVELDEALLVPGGQDVFANAYANISRDQVRTAIQSLAPEQREVIELFYFGGLSFTEIAEKVGIPVGTAKSRVRLALGRLRTEVGERLEP